MIKKTHGYIQQDKIKSINRRFNKRCIYSKELIYSCFAICFLFSCTQKNLNPKQLTTIPVERKTDKQDTLTTILSESKTIEIKQDISISSPKDTIKQEEKKYHIIVASFSRSQKIDAENLKNDLRKQGYEASLIASQGRVRISIESFKTENQALNKLDYYIDRTRIPDIWVLKYP